MTDAISNENIVLVTGGAGFIGSHTVEHLLNAGYRVRVLDNLSSGKPGNLPQAANLQFVQGDILDKEMVQRCMQGVRWVMHLAAQVSVDKSIHDPVHSCRENVLGFLIVLDEAKRIGARLVYASSAAVYGDPTELPLNESSPLNPISPYGLEKITNEQYADLYQRLYNSATLGLRYFNVYGPRQDPTSSYSGVITKFIHMMLANRPLTLRGDGKQERDFIHVSDVARANLAALFCDQVGVVNVASGKATSIWQLTGMMAQAFGREVTLSYVQDVPGDIRQSVAANARMQAWLCEPQWTLKEGLSEFAKT